MDKLLAIVCGGFVVLLVVWVLASLGKGVVPPNGLVVIPGATYGPGCETGPGVGWCYEYVHSRGGDSR